MGQGDEGAASVFLSNRVCLNLCLHLNSFCLCARPHVHDATLGGDYIPAQSEVSLQLCSLLFFSLYPLIPSLVPLKWQFVKHGPLLALSFASQPFPARLLASPPSVVSPPHSSLHITRFTPFPLFHFHTSCASATISLSLSVRRFILFIHPSKCDCYSTYCHLCFFISCPLFLLHSESPLSAPFVLRDWFS